MNTDIIYYKLEILKRYVDRILAKTPQSSKALAEAPDCQDIILMNLQRVVKICVDIAAYILANSNIPPPHDHERCFLSVAHVGNHFKRNI
jgi:uncharacterized protein YutE (UPF0331/DUF86 family)